MPVLPATLSLILNRTLPLTIGVFAIMLVQLVDTIFIGQLGVDQLAVQGITLPFYTVIIGFQVGMGVAATCIISRAIGNKNQQEATVTAFIAVVYGIALIAAVCLLLWFLKSVVFSLFISSEISAEQFSNLQSTYLSYWPIWLCSSTLGALLYLISAVYRANDDTKTPGMIPAILMTLRLAVSNYTAGGVSLRFIFLGIRSESGSYKKQLLRELFKLTSEPMYSNTMSLVNGLRLLFAATPMMLPSSVLTFCLKLG